MKGQEEGMEEEVEGLRGCRKKNGGWKLTDEEERGRKESRREQGAAGT